MQTVKSLIEYLKEKEPSSQIEYIILNETGGIMAMSMAGDALAMREVSTAIINKSKPPKLGELVSCGDGETRLVP